MSKPESPRVKSISAATGTIPVTAHDRLQVLYADEGEGMQFGWSFAPSARGWTCSRGPLVVGIEGLAVVVEYDRAAP